MNIKHSFFYLNQWTVLLETYQKEGETLLYGFSISVGFLIAKFWLQKMHKLIQPKLYRLYIRIIALVFTR